MYNLVQCTRCGKKLHDEEYQNHSCVPKIHEWKTIKYTNSYSVENDDGTKTVSYISQDGINYDFIEIPENKEFTKIPWQPKSNTEKTTDDETEPEIIPKI